VAARRLAGLAPGPYLRAAFPVPRFVLTDAVQRLSTALADRYVIERELGSGGMATVYLAHDVRHDRKVALKVLRPELSAILGAERFLAEIKTTAHLQHPHILPLHDSGEADGLVFYVMPYVEGESLRDRLLRERQLPVDESVWIARQVADALEYAHEQGIIHRDIKPENILLHGGHALVADFGIALAASRSEGATRMTETGMSLGTPAYMAPEQAMGERDISARADVYALGCVLYEMLAGEPPFTGPTAQAIIARVMTETPRSLTLQRHTVPGHLEAVVRKALEKLPADRFASAAQFAEALASPGGPLTGAGAAAATAAKATPRIKAPRFRAVLPWLVTAASLGLAAWSLWRPRPVPPPPPVSRYAIHLPDSIAHQEAGVVTIAIAPDASAFAYVSRSGLQVRYADRVEAEAVRGGRNAENPFFSPDGRWLGFRIGPRLVKVSLDGGAPVTICDSCVGYNFDWGTDDTIRFHAPPPDNGRPRALMAVPARGGRATILARPDTSSRELFRSPIQLPGRRTVLFTIWSPEAQRLATLDLDTRTITRFDQTGITPAWVDGGFVVLSNQDGTLSAVPFDAKRVRITGPPVTVVRDDMQPHQFATRAAISRSGTIVYLRAGAYVDRRLALVSRSGQVTDITAEQRAFSGPRLSPDGTRLAVGIGDDAGGSDVWLLDIAADLVTPDHRSQQRAAHLDA
jgi:serine/threonine-protein kinase